MTHESNLQEGMQEIFLEGGSGWKKKQKIVWGGHI